MRLKSVIESALRASPPLYRLGSRVYHMMNPQFRTLSPGAPGAIHRGFEFSLKDKDARAFEGDYYEFGIFRGGTFLEAGRTIETLGCDKAKMYGFDSFEGLPAPEGIDATDTRFFEGQFSCSREEVEKNLASHGMDMSRAQLVQGFYEDSLTEELLGKFPFKPASVALLDCDYYSSTKVALDWLTPFVRPGTVLLFDDWYSYGDTSDLGQPKALADWLLENPQFTTEEFGKFEHNGQGYVIRAAKKL